MSTSYTTVLAVLLALASIVQCRPGPTDLDQDDHVVIKRSADEDLKEKAFAYYKKLHTDHLCHMPQERMLSVQQIHPANAVSYTTGCVLLHRCAEDTGCCAPGEVCVAKDTEEVEIPILVTKVGDEDVHAQMMTFVDHTSCECLPEKSVVKH